MDNLETLEKTRPIPRIFYYCEGTSAWLPLEDRGNFDPDLMDGEKRTIEIKRIDMTDAEFAAIPEST